MSYVFIQLECPKISEILMHVEFENLHFQETSILFLPYTRCLETPYFFSKKCMQLGLSLMQI